jgi:hypothetical protein
VSEAFVLKKEKVRVVKSGPGISLSIRQWKKKEKRKKRRWKM